MQKRLTADECCQMMEVVCDAIIANKDYLTEVDSKIGDGDHGIGMAGGMEKAKAALDNAKPFEDINTVFKTIGMAMLNSMGGASGVIFGSMFLGGVKNLPSTQALGGQELTVIMRGGLNQVKERGKAQVGDKTMVDALEPAVVAMENAQDEELGALLRQAADAAAEGLEKTKNYVAKFGRAKSLMERAVGYQDAGATSVVIIICAMRDFIEQME